MNDTALRARTGILEKPEFPDKGHDPQTYAIIGAAMEVHRRLGHGFLEAVYQEAMTIELGYRGIPFVREAELPIRYRGELLNTMYRVDFLCFDSVVVELKALAKLTSVESAQLLNYLNAAAMERGLLLNFGAKELQYKRHVLTGRGRKQG